MIQTRLALLDVMDRLPVAEAEVETKITVVPRFEDRIVVDDGTARTPDGDPIGIRARPPKGTHEALRPDFDLGRTITKRGTTDERGTVAATFAVTDAFSELREGTEKGRPADVVGILSARIRAGPLNEEFFFHGGIWEEDGPNLLSSDETVTRTLDSVDFGRSIVGDTTGDRTSLFFAVRGTPEPDDAFVCELEPVDAAAVSEVETAVISLDEELGNTGVAHFENLDADTQYRYTLFQRTDETVDDVRTGRPLIRGRIHTEPEDRDDLTFVFSSCHLSAPENPNEDVLHRWQELADRDDYDFVLLVGDQVYGDGLDGNPFSDWRTGYLTIYDRFWQYRPVREVMRTTPTYMMLDDHDVDDDFGTVPVLPGRRDAALDTYYAFQMSHGPGRDSDRDGPYNYSFRRGPASFFVADVRTQRTIDPEDHPESRFPVFAERQWDDLLGWKREILDSDVDVVFFVTPIPIAFLPVEEIRRAAKELQEEAGTAGMLIGGAFAFPLGAWAGHEAGEAIARSFLDKKGLIDLTDRDLKDMWTFGPNQPDLVRVLDLLFDIANDVGEDGTVGDHQRAVFVLGGDVHSGSMHTIRSLHDGDGRDHSRNPVILQAISSPISNTPVHNETYRNVVEHVQSDADADIQDAVFGDPVGGTFGEDDAKFFLDDAEGRNYVAEIIDLLTDGSGEDERLIRNFGRVEVDRRSGREYRFRVSVNGQTEDGSPESIVEHFLLDLTDDPVRPRTDDASFDSQRVPRTMPPREKTPVSVTMTNTGTSTWTRDRYSLGLRGSDAWNIDRVPLPKTVAPGELVTFRFEVATFGPGDFDFQWQLLRRPDSHFGALSRRVRVEVSSVPDESDEECDRLAEELEAAERELELLQEQLKNVADPEPGPVGGGGFGGVGGGIGRGGGIGGGAGKGPGPGVKAGIKKQIDKQRSVIQGIEERMRRKGCD